MDDGSGDSRREQKQMLAQLIGSAMDAESKGDHEHLIKHALAAVKLSAVLGEAPSASFAYVQLSSGFTRMREFRKAEAYAKNALAIAGAKFPTSLLMDPEHPLAPRNGGVEIPGLSHPCSSYSLKTQAYIRSTAYLALGNVLSAKLQPSKAIKAFMLALKALERFETPRGSPASATIASVRSSLHNNIGNQHSKENMHAEALAEYEQALTLAAEAAGVTGDQAQLQALQATIAGNKARMEEGVGALGGTEEGRRKLADEMQAGLLAQWDSGSGDFDSKVQLASTGVTEAVGDPLKQREWIGRVAKLHLAERGDALSTVCTICGKDTLATGSRAQPNGDDDDEAEVKKAADEKGGEGGEDEETEEQGSDLFFTSCAHVFHSACLEGMSKGSNGALDCPACAAPIKLQSGRSAVGGGGGWRSAADQPAGGDVSDAVAEAIRNGL